MILTLGSAGSSGFVAKGLYGVQDGLDVDRRQLRQLDPLPLQDLLVPFAVLEELKEPVDDALGRQAVDPADSSCGVAAEEGLRARATMMRALAILFMTAALTAAGLADEIKTDFQNHLIADNVVDNVRELEGSLIRVAAYSSLHRVPLSEDVAKQVLGDLLPASRPRVITPQVILEETAKMFGWTVEDLCGKNRRRPLVTARQIGMYVFRELTDYSYPKIAEEFGGRDHTTVMHACEKIRAQMAEKHVVFEQVNELISRIKHGASG